ncbi:hypothetical protein BDA99DRAFT_537355 [Phascolomyces articulosus]|uniref:Uncharacterized protein n=1 Tax=Phascolomyces articulosus TaxID=60185 RepID=A0AAD5KA02_9FUNG|nr:hypothetical protein BDA99DRAFT_537355 [Phascolomyces articulosus]
MFVSNLWAWEGVSVVGWSGAEDVFNYNCIFFRYHESTCPKIVLLSERIHKVEQHNVVMWQRIHSFLGSYNCEIMSSRTCLCKWFDQSVSLFKRNEVTWIIARILTIGFNNSIDFPTYLIHLANLTESAKLKTVLHTRNENMSFTKILLFDIYTGEVMSNINIPPSTAKQVDPLKSNTSAARYTLLLYFVVNYKLVYDLLTLHVILKALIPTCASEN